MLRRLGKDSEDVEFVRSFLVDQIRPAGKEDHRDIDAAGPQLLDHRQSIAIRILIEHVVDHQHIDLFFADNVIEAAGRRGLNCLPAALLCDAADDCSDCSLVVDYEKFHAIWGLG